MADDTSEVHLVTSLAFELERAQRAAYYAANYLRDHPGHTEAQEGYRAASARVEEIVAEMQKTDGCPEREEHV